MFVNGDHSTWLSELLQYSDDIKLSIKELETMGMVKKAECLA